MAGRGLTAPFRFGDDAGSVELPTAAKVPMGLDAGKAGVGTVVLARTLLNSVRPKEVSKKAGATWPSMAGDGKTLIRGVSDSRSIDIIPLTSAIENAAHRRLFGNRSPSIATRCTGRHLCINVDEWSYSGALSQTQPLRHLAPRPVTVGLPFLPLAQELPVTFRPLRRGLHRPPEHQGSPR